MADAKAPKEYWDKIWQQGVLPRAVNPRDRSLKNQANLEFHRYFQTLFEGLRKNKQNPELVELGCARSAWLPYFAKEFNFRVFGIDFSEQGCDQARAILMHENAQGEIIKADIFATPDSLRDRFDLAVSFGLVEHFEDTASCLRSCSAVVRPGGMMITVVPNMNGLMGYLQKLLDREVFDVHVPIDTDLLWEGHKRAELQVLECTYFGFLNCGVLNLSKIRKTTVGLLFSRMLNALSAMTWTLERLGIYFPANRLSSPYVICVARKPD